jgi:hypothetical protein
MANAQNHATLSDGLAAMIRTIEPTRKTGLVMTRPNVAILLEGLQALLDEARHLETIADKAQWNERARRDAQRARREGLEEAISEGTVAVFPVVPRPTAVRQGDEGGAA